MAGTQFSRSVVYSQRRRPTIETESSIASEVRRSNILDDRNDKTMKSKIEPAWPALDEAAYHGPLGEIIRRLEPHTEASLEATLIQFLVALGNVFGRAPYFQVEATKHYLNLFVAIVGQTSQGRKGTSWNLVKRGCTGIDAAWSSSSILSGLSSGEGLIQALKDEEHGKRVTVVESEFARVLKAMGRDGNVLSNILREAWDGNDLRIMTRNNPVSATGGHVSLVVHVTEEDLRAYLDQTDAANGFANRFLWTLARRSKVLPEGGQLIEADWEAIHERLRDPVAYARGIAEMKRHDSIRDQWYDAYSFLTEDREGVFGNVTARAPAQVMRIACIYALLDERPTIYKDHLDAALAVWNYCEASARIIFSRSQADVIEERIKQAVVKSEQGLTKTKIRDLFHRNVEAAKINEALVQLQLDGYVERRVQNHGVGRPAEVFVPTAKLRAEGEEAA